jgi:hypothetical protein
MGWTRTILGTLAAALALAPAAHAATFTVTGTTDAGTCADTACESIRAALAAAAAADGPDEIRVPAGQFELTQGALVVDSPVQLVGASARTTVIQAAPGARTLESFGATASLAHLTLRQGSAPDAPGGNLLVLGGTVTLDAVRLTAGRAGTGAGAALRGGTLLVADSLVDQNVATGDGGGLANLGDALASGALTVTDSTVAANGAARGAGLSMVGSAQSTVALDGVTVGQNQGGGLLAEDGTASVTNSVVGDNAGGDCAGAPPVSGGFNVEAGDACAFTAPGDRAQVGDVGLDAELLDTGGETNVLPLELDSPAVNVRASGCRPTDQRGVTRPQGPACDAGAQELAYAVRVDDGPRGTVTATSAQFGFSSATAPGATFECALDTPGGGPGAYAGCTPGQTYSDLRAGAHTFHVRASADGTLVGEASRMFTVAGGGDAEPPVITFTAAPRTPTNAPSATLAFSADEPATFRCRLGDADFGPCESGWTVTLAEGANRLEVEATDAAGNRAVSGLDVVLDTVAPAPVTAAEEGPGRFVFAGEAGATFECALEGPGEAGAPAPCTSPASFAGLAPGEYRFTVVAVDAAGNRAAPGARAFTVTSPAVATPTLAPGSAPAPPRIPTAPFPAPRPQVGATVVLRELSGTVLVRRPGATGFVALDATTGFPLGSEIDTRSGRVVLTSDPGGGKPLQRAAFYGGLFVVTQTGGYVELRLSEALAPCGRSAAAAAQKPKSRKLWGDGKGNFRTRGEYSSATVRGTRWLVQDTCAGTLTRVEQGVVSVRDTARKRSVLLRAGRSYLARAKR